MSDEIRRLSDELARDPSSLVFLQLGEALRKSAQLALAHKVATRGLERHAHNADAHDLLARIYVDQEELEKAFDEWDMVIRLAPNHIGAQKGMGYVLYKQGKLEEAETHLSAAATKDSADASISTALRMVRRLLRYARVAGNGTGAPGAADLEAAQRRVEEEAHFLFADVIGDGEQTALLVNADGLVTAGAYITADGLDVAQEVGSQLSGVRDDAQRAVRHLDLGEWKTLLYETDVATVAIAPALDDSMVLVAASRAMPLGFVRRVLDRCVRRATMWLSEVG